MGRTSTPAPFLAIVACVVLTTFPEPAVGQDRPDWFLGSTVGEQQSQVSYDFRFYPEESVAGQGRDLQLTQHRLRVLFPIRQGERSEWVLHGNLKALDVDTEAVLPQAGVRFPGDLWDVNAGVAARRKLDNGWIVGGSLTVGSASDKPFASLDELSVQADAMVRVPWRPSLAWIGLLNYSSTREFAPHIPLPGLLLAYEPGPSLNVLAGIPFTAVRWRATEDLTLSAFYALIRRVGAQATYRVSPVISLFATFDWDSQRFLRAARQDDDARLTYYEKRAAGGIRVTFRRGIAGEIAGGYAFDRFWFEGESYGDRGQNRLDIGDGPFIAGRVSVEF